MRYGPGLLVPLLLVAAAGATAARGDGLSLERSGIGLKRPSAAAYSAPGLAIAAMATGPRDLDSGAAIYVGVREAARLGLAARESYGGIAYPLFDTVGASLELAAADADSLRVRRYSLTGQLHTAFASGTSLSVGLSYRLHVPDSVSWSGALLESAPSNGYALVPGRPAGTGFAPSYQLQLHYQYSTATTFGLVLGRDLETFTPGFEHFGTGLRQFSFTGQHWLTPSWALSYDLLSEDPGSLRVQGLRLGVRYRF